MQLNSPLPQSVEIQASNRPVRIAYLVETENSEINHMVLDAIFYESYTRWGGVYTLIIPTASNGLLQESYQEWVENFDPDFIYSYVDLDETCVQLIDRLCCPIALLRHKVIRMQVEKSPQWNHFIPDLSHYIQPVSSISTIPSPPASPAFLPPFAKEKEKFVLTQFSFGPKNRFISDNFGTNLQRHSTTHPIQGLFSTLCLTPEDLPANHYTGTERCSSVLEALSALASGKASPVALYASVHSEAAARYESHIWGGCFHIFIGNSVRERIHFWNCRLLNSSTSTPLSSLIVEPIFFDDNDSIKQLGLYLNRFNFLNRSSSQYQVELHSSTETDETLRSIRPSGPLEIDYNPQLGILSALERSLTTFQFPRLWNLSTPTFRDQRIHRHSKLPKATLTWLRKSLLTSCMSLHTSMGSPAASGSSTCELKDTTIFPDFLT
jgi:hypothetical protein